MASAKRNRRLPQRSLNVLKRKLLEKRAAVLGEVQHRHRERQLDSSEQVLEPGDVASREQDAEFIIMMAEADSRELSEIQDALDRIDAGEYGQCEICHQPIGSARLRALPYVRKCLECKRREEETGIVLQPSPVAKEGPGLAGDVFDVSTDADDAEIDVRDIEISSPTDAVPYG